MLLLLSEVIFFQRISKKIILALSELGVKKIVLTHFYALVAPETFKSENCNCDGYISASQIRCYKHKENPIKRTLIKVAKLSTCQKKLVNNRMNIGSESLIQPCSVYVSCQLLSDNVLFFFMSCLFLSWYCLSLLSLSYHICLSRSSFLVQ